MTQLHDCEEYLTLALAEDHLGDTVDPPDEVECEKCREALVAFERNEARLRDHFAALSVPEMPRLPLRDALQAASGHPRRVSSNVLPIAWLVALLVLLGVLYALGEILRWRISDGS